jgi:hypothetical protein
LRLALQEPGAKVTQQLDDAGLALVEGDEVSLVVGVEHQVEGGRRVGQPLPAQRFLVRSAAGRLAHGAIS